MTIHATDATFEELIADSERLVVVDFWAPWCGPCKGISPLLDSLSSEHDDKVRVVKVNIDETAIAPMFKIRGIPTLIVFEQGKPVRTHVGGITKSKLLELVGITE